MRVLITIVLTVVLIFVLLSTVMEMPEFGLSSNPAHNYVMEGYLKDGMAETGAVNIVTAIILEYRAFDTLGEATVLFTAVISLLLILSKNHGKEDMDE